MANDRRWFLSLAGSSFLAAITRKVRAQPPVTPTPTPAMTPTMTPVPLPANPNQAAVLLITEFRRGLVDVPDLTAYLPKILRRVYLPKITAKWPLTSDKWNMLLHQSEFLGCLTRREWNSASPPQPNPTHDDLSAYLISARDGFRNAAADPNDYCQQPLRFVPWPVEKDCVIC